MGGAAEGAGSGAVVRCFQGRPGSHEVAETLLQVGWEVIKGHLVVLLCNVSRCVLGFRMVSICFMILNGNVVVDTIK